MGHSELIWTRLHGSNISCMGHVAAKAHKTFCLLLLMVLMVSIIVTKHSLQTWFHLIRICTRAKYHTSPDILQSLTPSFVRDTSIMAPVMCGRHVKALRDLQVIDSATEQSVKNNQLVKSRSKSEIG